MRCCAHSGGVESPGPTETRERMKEQRLLQVIVWRALAVACLALAVLGALLPLLPSVPFLLAAAWAGSKGWPQLERWLLDHPRHGPAIRRWRDQRALPRRAKWLATFMMAASGALLVASPLPSWLKLAAPAAMLAVALWLWRRPDA